MVPGPEDYAARAAKQDYAETSSNTASFHPAAPRPEVTRLPGAARWTAIANAERTTTGMFTAFRKSISFGASPRPAVITDPNALRYISVSHRTATPLLLPPLM